MKIAGHTITIILGSLFLTICVFGYFRGHFTENWPATSGEIVSINLEQKFRLFRGKRSNPGSSKKYETKIVYKYNIEGQEYISESYEINFLGFKSNLSGSHSYLEDVLKVRQKYKPGSTVEVYYDPDSPAKALLVKGYQGYLPTYLLFSLLASGYGVYGIIKN